MKTNYIIIALIIVVLGLTVYIGLTAGPKNPTPTVTPTPTITSTPLPTTIAPTVTMTPTVTVTPTITDTVTPTPTPTVTATPASTQKKVVMSVKNATSDKYEITLDLPANTKVSASSTDLFLQDTANNNKTYMWFYVPYESFMKATYTSNVAVSSSIANLRRFTTKQDLGNGFKVAYATSDMILDTAVCANTDVGEAVESPCLTPAVKATLSFFAHCSAQSKYTPICDQIMKTIKVKDL